MGPMNLFQSILEYLNVLSIVCAELLCRHNAEFVYNCIE